MIGEFVRQVEQGRRRRGGGAGGGGGAGKAGALHRGPRRGGGAGGAGGAGKRDAITVGQRRIVVQREGPAVPARLPDEPHIRREIVAIASGGGGARVAGPGEGGDVLHLEAAVDGLGPRR